MIDSGRGIGGRGEGTSHGWWNTKSSMGHTVSWPLEAGVSPKAGVSSDGGGALSRIGRLLE
jgi:hypothetical protein